MKLGWLAALCAGCGFQVGGTGDGGTSGDGAPDVPGPVVPTSPRKLTFDNTNVTTNLDNFPVLVPIAGQVDYTQIVDPRKDLRFEDPIDGATLAYEVESWTPNGESLVWVKVPKIRPAPAPAFILLHWGPNASPSDPAAVWSDYEQVHHFAASPVDAAANGHDGLAVGATTTTGFLGNGMTFTAAADNVTFSGKSFDSWHAGSLEMWIRPNYASVSDVVGEPHVITNSGSLQLGRFYIDGLGALVLQIDAKWTGGARSEIHPDLPFSTWSYLTWTYDQDTWRIYRNGQLGPSDQVGNHDFDRSDLPLVLGNDGGLNAAHMQIDELRTSKKNRSADWIRAQHASMTRNFVTFGDP